MKKQGVELTLNTIVIAVIVLIVLAVVLLIFASLYGGGANQLNDFFKGVSEDKDCDGMRDAVDPCPCSTNIPRDCAPDNENQPSGCPGTGGSCPQQCEKQVCT